MPPEVATLAETLLRDPLRVDVARTAPATLPIEQHVHFVEASGKRALLGRLLADPALSRVIVFTRTKRGANQVAEALDTGGVRVAALHGNKSQPARQKALEQFRTGRARVLVATDIAARGIDVTGISHVINFDLPAQPEDYVHRIGRTARAGASGVAISFCDVDAAGRVARHRAHDRREIADCGGSPPPVPSQRTAGADREASVPIGAGGGRSLGQDLALPHDTHPNVRELNHARRARKNTATTSPIPPASASC